MAFFDPPDDPFVQLWTGVTWHLTSSNAFLLAPNKACAFASIFDEPAPSWLPSANSFSSGRSETLSLQLSSFTNKSLRFFRVKPLKDFGGQATFPSASNSVNYAHEASGAAPAAPVHSICRSSPAKGKLLQIPSACSAGAIGVFRSSPAMVSAGMTTGGRPVK